MRRVNIYLQNNQWDYCSKDDESKKIWYRGTCYKRNSSSKYNFGAIKTINELEFEQLIKKINGFYALIYQNSDRLFVAVDHIRSIPLFYGIRNNKFYLSDDAEWIRQQVGDKEKDPIAKEEFQLAGYVTGRETLFPNVKQLQAGEFLVAQVNEQEAVVKCHRYYRFLHTEPESHNETDLEQGLDKATVNAIKRLIDYTEGRQIVVPLSGGYDSRLIVTMLKRLGHDNVLTFTYGVPGNKESTYSKQVAEALDLKWHFIEYSDELWRKVWQEPERWQYQKWASGWNGMAHMQDWLAVKMLKEKAVINSNCVFVPGHTGDFISGGHIPDLAFKKQHFSLDDLFDAIFSAHYNLAPIHEITNRNAEFWKQRILQTSEANEISSAEDLANAFEKWEWQERQAKFICNSVRVYEFFGYDWWLPLWDTQFMGYWQQVPLQFRHHRTFFIRYIEYIYSKQSSLDYSGTPVYINKPSLAKSVLKRLVNSLPNVLQSYIKSYYSLNIYRKHNVGAYSRYPLTKFKKLIREGYHINGISARFFLKDCDNYLT